ncbi:hypothetical protein VQ042_17470, partial [Aurantimonas sp. A2-1-M11]|uniref:hypothetical protein n=1 Tax=Aurantimonas sp. A2-1-M11 TaxID=3113712 RepID=UPI002F94C084
DEKYPSNYPAYGALLNPKLDIKRHERAGDKTCCETCGGSAPCTEKETCGKNGYIEKVHVGLLRATGEPNQSGRCHNQHEYCRYGLPR